MYTNSMTFIFLLILNFEQNYYIIFHISFLSHKYFFGAALYRDIIRYRTKMRIGIIFSLNTDYTVFPVISMYKQLIRTHLPLYAPITNHDSNILIFPMPVEIKNFNNVYTYTIKLYNIRVFHNHL